MSDEMRGIVPGVPFIPDQPPQVQELRVVEWLDRADLAEHAFDGQWRILASHPQFSIDVMERWVIKDDGFLYIQHCIRRSK